MSVPNLFSKGTQIAAIPSIAALRASYAAAFPATLEKRSFCPAFGRSDCAAGKSSDAFEPEEIIVVKGSYLGKFTWPKVGKITWALTLPFGREEANLFFHVIAKRYERASTIVTSNLPFAQWVATLAEDATLTAALLDRAASRAHRADQRGELSTKGPKEGGASEARRHEPGYRSASPFGVYPTG